MNTEQDQELDQLYETFLASPAAIDLSQVDTIEKNFQNNGVARRTLLLMLTKSGQELTDEISENRDFAVAVAEFCDRGKDYINYLDGIKEMMQTATMRMGFALCAREDMQEVLAEARSEVQQ